MKKKILLLLALTATTSCLHRADVHDQRTAYGAAILHEGVSSALAYNQFILAAVEIDIIAEAPTVEDRDRLADTYFPRFKFRTEGNKHSLSRDNVVYLEVNTDGQSLASPDAKWTITTYGDIGRQQPPITITCLTPDSWSLETMRTQQNTSLKFGLTLTSKRKTIDISPRKTVFETTIDNTTIIDQYRNVTHTLTTSNPLAIQCIIFQYPPGYVHYRVSLPEYNRYDIVGGTVTDNFLNPVNQTTELVEAAFSSSNKAKIKYSGFEDIWYWSTIPDYHISRYYYL